MVISSRKAERLEAAAQEMRQKIPSSSPASVTPVQCNIRNEDEVGSHTPPASETALCYHSMVARCLCDILFCAPGEGPRIVCAEAARQDRLPGEQWRRSVQQPSRAHVL